MAMKLPKIDIDNSLIGAFREDVAALSKKMKDPTIMEEVGMPIAYPTGFVGFDYYNGMRVPVLQDNSDTEYIYDAIGIGEGSINLFTGKSAVGKTTHLIQCIGGVLVSNPDIFAKSMVLYCDIEGGANKPRIAKLTGFDLRTVNKKFVLMDKGIDHQTLYNIVKDHCDLKIKRAYEDPDSIMYNTGIVEFDGTMKRAIVPTFVVVDSLDMLKASKIQENDEIGSNTNGMMNSKMNTELFGLLKPICKKANVIFCCVCHIKDNISMNSFIPVSKQTNYMKQNEKLSGGKNIIYLANNVFKYEAKTNIKEDDTSYGGLYGWEARITLIKSRLNRAGREFQLFYDQETGYNREYSAFMFLVDNGIIKKSGTRYALPSGELFFKKNLLKELDDPSFARSFRDAIINYGGKVLSNASSYNMSSEDDISVGDSESNSLEDDMMNSFSTFDI